MKKSDIEKRRRETWLSVGKLTAKVVDNIKVKTHCVGELGATPGGAAPAPLADQSRGKPIDAGQETITGTETRGGG